MQDKFKKESEKKLNKGETQFKETFDLAPIGICHLSLEGRFILFNKKLCDILGYVKKELLEKTFREITYPEDLAETMGYNKQILAGEIDHFSIEKRYIKKDKSIIWVNLTVSIVRDKKGKAKYFIAILEDIAQRKKAEQELQEFAEQLKLKNQELNDFAYIASHDLQEPLRKISLLGDLLIRKSKKDLDGIALDYLARIKKASRQMQAFINSLLAYTKVTLKEKHFVTIKLSIVLEEVLIDLEFRIEESKAKITVDTLPEIQGEYLQLKQLFVNLITNALKYRKDNENPVIHIQSEIVDEEKLSHSDMFFSTIVIITVIDNGTGFNEQDSERIFGMFQRAHEKIRYEGTGIGLAICRKIVERHRGTITAKNNPDSGSTFTIKFPLETQK